MSHHFDVLVIGSGFGGSVSALRLTEKGYRVAVMEAGRRFEDKDFPKTSWDIKNFLFAPRLGCNGIQRIHLLNDVVVLAGAGVGGGSLVYANTMYQPTDKYFNDPLWADITDWKSELDPWYQQARKMLGVADNPRMTPMDVEMKKVADQMGRGDTFRLTPVAVHFGETSEHPDPYFGGVGPTRSGCTHCGQCMTGCRFNAKNTLPKNYLGLAEKAGAKVFPDQTVVDLEQTATGWRITARATMGTGRTTYTADEVIFAAGALNSTRLLLDLQSRGRLPLLSQRIGEYVRTNSEALVGALMPTAATDFSEGVAITSSFYADDQTHIEPVRYGHGSSVMGLLQTFLTSGHTPKARRADWRKQFFKHPYRLLKILNLRKWSERTIIALVMQNVDSAVQVYGRNRFGRFWLKSKNMGGMPFPKWIPMANEVVEKIAANNGGIPAGNYGEIFGAPITAHILGGAIIGESADKGVIDPFHRVWNYPTLHVVDGAAVTANLGVNPSLTITAQAERALSFWPNQGQPDSRPIQGQPYLRIEPVAPLSPVVPQSAETALWTAQ